MENLRNKTIEIDINVKKFINVTYKQYDANNILQIILTNNGKILNYNKYNITLFFELPSGKRFKTKGNIVENAIKAILTSELLNEYGKVKLEIELIDEEKICTTFTVYINVEKSIVKNNVKTIQEDTMYFNEDGDLVVMIDNEIRIFTPKK